MILKAAEEKQKQTAWELWLPLYPWMTKENFVPFEKFYGELRKEGPGQGYKGQKLSSEEILKKYDAVAKAYLKAKAGD